MTESEWLASEDPAAMLRWITTETHPSWRAPKYSDRKLRLFACACYRAAFSAFHCNHGATDRAEAWIDRGCLQSDRPADSWFVYDSDPAGFANRMDGLDGAAKARILRDIIGNPFRPAMCVGRDWGRFACLDNTILLHERWLTTTVLAIVQAAYEERPGRKCEKCRGTGKDQSLVYSGPTASSTALDFVAYTSIMNSPCHDCHGTGPINDGTLDPVTLSILADALEDAGCPGISCQNNTAHCRSKSEYTVCAECGGDIGPHPILAHLRSPGPHVRGCWALDLILGKE